MDLLLQKIRAFTPVTDEEEKRLGAWFRHTSYKKNSVLLEEGQVAHELFLVIRGCLRQYFVTENGDERTCNFSFEGDFLTDLESFSRQNRASTNIATLEPTECLVITCRDIVPCMSESPAIASFFSSIVEQVASANIRRIQSLLSQTPEQRWDDIIQNRPQILQRVPQRYIAQYLGIAPESLSRIRKRSLDAAKS